MQRHLPLGRSLTAVAVMFVTLALGTSCTASDPPATLEITLQSGLETATLDAFTDSLFSRREVTSVIYVSSDELFELAQGALPDEPEIMSTAPADAFPALLEVECTDTDSAHALLDDLTGDPEYESVVSHARVVEE